MRFKTLSPQTIAVYGTLRDKTPGTPRTPSIPPPPLPPLHTPPCRTDMGPMMLFAKFFWEIFGFVI
jgi:hypothetical protein